MLDRPPYILPHRHMNTRRPNGKRRQYEVHYHHTYVPHHPWGATPSKDTVFPMPASRLCHATHNQQASHIASRGDGYYHLTPREKVGKSYVEGGCPLGESYRCILTQTPDAHTPCYRYIPDTEPVFPGYYSWWGLALDPQISLPWIESECLPPYLKRPPESVYGGNAFESDFPDLLQSYAASRGCGVEDIYLKVGGTLRYKREIAYVVIVCTSHDLGALNIYYPITHAPPDVFDPSGLVDDDGKVIDMARVPYFTTCYVNTYTSYETLNFAFYFSSPLEDFKCPSSTVEVHPIDHPFCIRTQPMVTWYNQNTRRFDTRWSCPDNERAQRMHANVTGFAMMVHGVGYGARAGGGVARSGTTWSGVARSGTTWSGVARSGTTRSGMVGSGVARSGTTWSGVAGSGVAGSDVARSSTAQSSVARSGTTWSGVAGSGVAGSGVAGSGSARDRGTSAYSYWEICTIL